MQEHSAGSRVAHRGKHRRSVPTGDHAGVAKLPILGDGGQEGNLVSAGARDLLPQAQGGVGTEKQFAVVGFPHAIHRSSNGSRRLGLIQCLAQSRLVGRLDRGNVEVAQAHGLPGILRTDETRGVDAALGRGGVAVLDLDQPATPPLVLEYGTICRHARVQVNATAKSP